MTNSLLRVLVTIGATAAVVASLLLLGWYQPQVLFVVFLAVFAVFWVWALSRSLRTGVVSVKGLRYVREKSPAAYWSWLGFYFSVGLYLLGGGAYALIFLKF